MLAVLAKDLRLLLRDRWALLFSLLVPILVITIIAEALFHSDSGPKLLLPVVNLDGGPVASAFIKLLGEHADVVQMNQEAAERLVRDENKAPAAIVFPEHLSKQYLQGRTSQLTLLTDPAQGTDLQTVKVLLLLMDKEAATLADPLEEEKISMVERNLTGNKVSVTAFEQNVPGFSIMFVLLSVVLGTATSLHDERQWGTLSRLLVAPAGFSWMVLGKLGARVIAGVGQMALLLLFGHWAFGISLGSSVGAFFVLTVAVVLPAVAAGTVVGGVAKTREQTLPLGLAVVLALSALGGLWWPPTIQPVWMQRIGDLAFTTWAMRGMMDLVLRDRGLLAIATPVGMLLLHTVGLLGVGLGIYRVQHSPR